MLAFLPTLLKGALAGWLFVINTILWCVLIYVLVIVRWVLPWSGARQTLSRWMVAVAENWVSCNSLNIAITQKIQWEVQYPAGLDKNKSYLICCNHQSWADIVLLQHIFNRRIPFIRFFLKHQLIYVPLLGWAWSALDFPFMRRYTKSYLSAHPEKRGEDLRATRKACEKFAHIPVSILNFLEGTRCTPEKMARQNSPYQYLLNPKSGGLGYVLNAMGDKFAALLDVTIYYPGRVPTLWQLLCGRCERLVIDVRLVSIPASLIGGDYLMDADYRLQLHQWVKDIWQLKDDKLRELRGVTVPTGS